MSAPALGSPAPCRLSFIVPCYNEQLRLAATLDLLTAWYPEDDVQFVVVDDGSTDRTADVGDEAARLDARVSVVRGGSNRGKGGAIAAARGTARGDVLVVVDADLPYDHPSMDRAVEAAARHDVAIANRRHPESSYVVPVRLLRAVAYRHVLGGVFNRLVRMLLPIDVRDTQSGLKAFRRAAFESVFDQIRIERFAFDLDLLMVARCSRLSVCDFPVQVRFDASRGTVRLLRDGPRMLADLLRVARWWWTGDYASRTTAREPRIIA